MEAAKSTAKIVGKTTAILIAIPILAFSFFYVIGSVFGFYAVPVALVIIVLSFIITTVYDSEKQIIEYKKRYNR
jgi:uncharacterized membrane protein